MLITELKYIKGKGYYFGEKTFYSPSHLGIDYPINNVLVEFPVDLVRCTFTTGKEGGLTVTGTDKAGYIHRFMHLASFGTLDDAIKAGTTFARSGNSGELTTSPHLHWDVRKPNMSTLQFKNFINPDDWKKEILPNLLPMTKVPQWFVDNQTDKWAENKAIRIDQSNLTDSDCRELESLKKATQPADIEVTTIITKELSREELRAYKLSIREVTKFFDGYVNLMFKEPEIRDMSLTLTNNRLNYTPSKGLNVILYPDREVGKMKNDNVNGFMVVNQRTTVIVREILLREDSRHRSEYHYAATLAHELMHWFATKLDFEVRQDRTHYFDYEYTLANYLPKLAFGLLHDKNFRTNNGL